MLLPETHDPARYEAEPFVLPADVCAAAGLEGVAGWTWYTGSAGWYFRVVCEGLLGLRLAAESSISRRPRQPPPSPSAGRTARARPTASRRKTARLP